MSAPLPLTAAQAAELAAALRGGGPPDDPAALIDLIGSLAYDASRRRAGSEQGVPARHQDRGVAAEIALDAPIRHGDHVVPAADGGTTSEANGQGLCEACNHVKESPGRRHEVVADLRHAVEAVTPGGHRYRSASPPPVGWREPRWVRDLPGVYTLVA